MLVTIKKECSVLLLPTKYASETCIIQSNNNGLLSINKDQQYFTRDYLSNVLNATAHHLYVLSDDKIEYGDYWYDIIAGINVLGVTSLKPASYSKKIIATTDEKLTTIKCIEGGNVMNGGIPIMLPKIPSSFIQLFIDSYNNGKPITNASVTYESEYYSGGTVFDEPKINQEDGTIDISIFVKNNFTNLEVQYLFRKFIADMKSGSEFFEKHGDIPGGFPALHDKWLEEHGLN